MRMYIHGISQKRAMELRLGNDELLLLDYFYKFFVEHEDDTRRIRIGDNFFYLMRYSKLIHDLPILGDNTKIFQRMIVGLESKQILRRNIAKNRDMYLCIDWQILQELPPPAEEKHLTISLSDIGQNCLTATNMLNKFVSVGVPKCPAIDNYIYNNINNIEADIKNWIRINASSDNLITYDCWFKTSQIIDISKDQIIFEFRSKIARDEVKNKHIVLLRKAIFETLFIDPGGGQISAIS